VRRRLRIPARLARHLLAVLEVLALRCTARRAGVVLMYHRVEPRQGDPAREFTPPVACALFERHLRHVRRHFRPVPAAELQAAAAARRRGGRFPVAVTFDDDTASHVRHAAPLLRRHGVPATFFLNGLGLERPCAYWWELLQAAYDADGAWANVLPPAMLEEARRRAGGEPQAWHVSKAIEDLGTDERRALTAALRERLGGDPPDSGLRRAQVRELVEAGFCVGFHGAHHEPLALLGQDAMEAELDERRAELEELIGAAMRTIAYPHGSGGEREAHAAQERGFVAGFTIVDEAVTPASHPLLQGRLDAQLPYLSRLAHGMARQLRRAT
jgi:peptidoglycan/xylan/chitin deacetylase (PgdA/CDA1 family)